MPYPQDFEDFLDGIDEEQLLRDIGEDELARQADMFELLQKKEATVEDGQIVRGPPTQRSRHGSQTPQTPRTTHTPSRKHSSSATLADPGQLGKFFDPGPESQGDPAGDTRVEESGQEKAEGSQEEEAFDCTAEIVPYDVDGELVAAWNELQARVEREIETFSHDFIRDAFKLVLELSSGVRRLHEETRQQLEDIVANIREEEGRHAHGVALMNDYYAKMDAMLEVMRHPIGKI